MHAPAHERVLTELDHARLVGLLARLTASRHLEATQSAHDLVETAPTLPAQAVPPDLITMRTRIQLCDDAGREHELTLAYPAEANAAQGHISVLSPLGLSLLGCREGQTIQWQGPDRVVHHGTVARILYQPEAAGDFGI
jgi:regulator of nucleoside diphosphate kinase